jgi:hypothetical protein
VSRTERKGIKLAEDGGVQQFMFNNGLDEPDGGKSLDVGHVVLEEWLPPPARLVQDHVTRGGQGRGGAGVVRHCPLSLGDILRIRFPEQS